MMKNKSGISLAELLIAIGIVGILAALTVPSVVKTLPNENEIRYRQVYGRMLSAVSSLAFDNLDKFPVFLYCSNKNTATANSKCNGKLEGQRIYSAFRLLDDDGKVSDVSVTGPYFCTQIAKMFNVKSAVNCEYNDNLMQENFRTQNGMIFYGLQQGFGTKGGIEQKQITFCVDTNGDEAPNHGCTSDYNDSEKDQFRMQIGFKGDVAVGYDEQNPTDGTGGMYDSAENLSYDYYCANGKDDLTKCKGAKIDRGCKGQGTGGFEGAANYCIERQFLDKTYLATNATNALTKVEQCQKLYDGVLFAEYNNLCVSNYDTPYTSINTCSTSSSDMTAPDPFCVEGCSYCAQNDFAGAVQACRNKNMQLTENNEMLVAFKLSTGEYGATLASPISSSYYYWSGLATNVGAIAYNYDPTSNSIKGYLIAKTNPSVRARCVRMLY